jgi:hypothetical protein
MITDAYEVERRIGNPICNGVSEKEMPGTGPGIVFR